MTPPPTDPVNVLLVDDLAENLLALEALLRRDGLVLLKARSGPQALELLLRHEVALALVDVQMPGMDGFELAELMRGTARTRRVPLIFLTAAGVDRQRRFRGYEAGAVDFLHKPIEPDVLRSKAEVFIELFRQRQEVARQRDELKAATEENARLLEESRKTAAALTEVDRRRTEFLATLAHELRNPLAPLRNGLQVIRLAAGDPTAVARAREMMERQLGQLVHLVDDLLDVSRLTSGKIVLKPERIEIRQIVEAAVETARPLIEANRHELVLSLPDAPLPVDGDRHRLAQVLTNLLNNAAKYTPPGGIVRVQAGRVGGRAVVSVQDTGIGIPADMLPRVFDMFTQVGTSIDRSQGGLGIGLTLVQKLVEMHGGTVTAESRGTDHGCTFTVSLPLAPEAVGGEPSAQGTDAAPRLPGRRVLVVDDNVDAAESLAMLLRLSGHEVRTAHTGPAGLDTAHGFKPEVVFLDIGLPEMNGYEVARHLREGPTRDNPAVVVALTGWGTEDDRQRAKEAGFDHHLTKPVDARQLGRLLAQLPSNPPRPA